MNEHIQLKIGNLPKAMGTLVHSNQFLKMTSVSTLGLCLLLVGLLYLSLSKPPTVLAMNPNAELYRAVDPPKLSARLKKPSGPISTIGTNGNLRPWGSAYERPRRSCFRRIAPPLKSPWARLSSSRPIKRCRRRSIQIASQSVLRNGRSRCRETA